MCVYIKVIRGEDGLVERSSTNLQLSLLGIFGTLKRYFFILKKKEYSEIKKSQFVRVEIQEFVKKDYKEILKA